MASTRQVLQVDARGRVSLGKLGIKDTQLIADRHPDGTVTLQPALTPAEAAHYSNPKNQEVLDAGLRDLEEDRVTKGQLRTDRRNS